MDVSVQCIVHIPVIRIIKEVFLENKSKYIHCWKCSVSAFDFQLNVGWFLYWTVHNLSEFLVQYGAFPLTVFCELAQSDKVIFFRKNRILQLLLKFSFSVNCVNF